jgi:hypothetical protein
MPFEEQATSLTFRYQQSTYGIAALNESLPRYTTRNYTLAPFEPLNQTGDSFEGRGTYNGPTTMYQLDLTCEDASRKAVNNPDTRIFYNSSTGCHSLEGLTGNTTMNYDENSDELFFKEFVGRYVGYHNGGSADWYLSTSCPTTANTTFYAGFGRTKVCFTLCCLAGADLVHRPGRRIHPTMSPLSFVRLITGGKRCMQPLTDRRECH